GRYNSDLANGLGNLSSRTLTMIRQYRAGEIPLARPSLFQDLADQAIAATVAAFENFEFSRALETVWALISRVDKYIVEMAPWNLARQNMHEPLDQTLYAAAEALRVVTVLLYP